MAIGQRAKLGQIAKRAGRNDVSILGRRVFDPAGHHIYRYPDLTRDIPQERAFAQIGFNEMKADSLGIFLLQ